MKKLDPTYISKFENLDYAAFKKMAVDPNLLPHEKVGFPTEYRQGKEPLIWQDIQSKLTNLNLPHKLILDIGPGCSDLPKILLAHAQTKESKVILCDCQEMLSQLPNSLQIEKVEGPFPHCWHNLSKYLGAIDTILVYSVFHYVIGSQNRFTFFDRCLDSLAHQGQLLLGDLPNCSKRKRFFNSPAGIEFHKQYIGKDEMPDLSSPPNKESLDDFFLLSLITRAQEKGFDAYILPQAKNLPMSNRRDDILIIRP